MSTATPDRLSPAHNIPRPSREGRRGFLGFFKWRKSHHRQATQRKSSPSSTKPLSSPSMASTMPPSSRATNAATPSLTGGGPSRLQLPIPIRRTIEVGPRGPRNYFGCYGGGMSYEAKVASYGGLGCNGQPNRISDKIGLTPVILGGGAGSPQGESYKRDRHHKSELSAVATDTQ